MALFGPAAFSPDGKQFAWQVKNQLHVFDVSTGKEQLVMPQAMEPFYSGIAISPNGDLALLTGKEARLIRLPSGAVVGSLPAPDIFHTAQAFAPDGRSLALGTSQGTIRIYETASLGERATLETGGAGVVRLAFSAHGRWLTSGLNDSSLLVWDLARVARK
jgi:WD40 repeat protein